jgi:hypothetical protein
MIAMADAAATTAKNQKKKKKKGQKTKAHIPLSPFSHTPLHPRP